MDSTNFSKFYVNHIDNTNVHGIKTLPLVHTCDGHHFRGILVREKILPTHCPVFEQDLSYFFYGRPSYRVNSDGKACSSLSNFPVCLVIDPEHVDSLEAVYPFDTGAYKANLYKEAVHKDAKVEDFKFTPNFDFIKKFIALFYKSNENYYFGKVQINQSEIPPLSFELQSIYSLAANIQSTNYDDRCSAIEVQIRQEFSIVNKSVRAIILPASFYEDETISEYLYRMNIKGIPYETMHWNPSSITTFIIKNLNDYYRQEGILA